MEGAPWHHAMPALSFFGIFLSTELLQALCGEEESLSYCEFLAAPRQQIQRMHRHAAPASGVSRQQKLAALLDIAWHFGLLQALIPPIEDAFEDVSRLGEACNSWL